MQDQAASARVRWSLQHVAASNQYALTGDVLVARESWLDRLRRFFCGKARATCAGYASYVVLFSSDFDPCVSLALAAGQMTVQRALELMAAPDTWVELCVDPAAAALGIRQWLE